MGKRIPRMRTNKVNPRKGGQRDDGQGKGDTVDEEQEEGRRRGNHRNGYFHSRWRRDGMSKCVAMLRTRRTLRKEDEDEALIFDGQPRRGGQERHPSGEGLWVGGGKFAWRSVVPPVLVLRK